MPTFRFGALALATLLAAASLGLAGCSALAQPGATSSPASTEISAAGDIPDSQAFVGARAASGDFEVRVPEGWAESRSGNSLRFSDKSNSVAVDEGTAQYAPTVGSVTSQDVPELQKTVPNFVFTDATAFTRGGGSGVLIRYSGDSAPDPVTHKTVRQAFERYLFWSSGKLAALTLAGAEGADNVDPWMKVSESFRWLKP
jgi:hypothetical protein